MSPFKLGPQWPTKDPFLFVAHHLDNYPVGNAQLGPAAELTGRNIGQDFANLNGWNMYHGDTVPGFPQHPHRGFETVTYVRTGFVDHSDSLGATARYGQGDTQWLTAGSGIVHAEMFPLLRADRTNPLELFQIWINLPRASKMADPHFSMLWAENTPVVKVGANSRATVVAGSINSHHAQAPPPDSWAARHESEVAIWHLELTQDDTWALPSVGPEANRTLYFYRGSRLDIASPQGGQTLESGHGVEIEGSDVELRAEGGTAWIMLLQGKAIGEPVAQYGPFVLNDRAGIEQAFRDYRETGFGGWPWTRDDPAHPAGAGRFAIRPGGANEVPTTTRNDEFG